MLVGRALLAGVGFWQTISGVPEAFNAAVPFMRQYDVAWRIAFLILAFVLAGTAWRELEAVPRRIRRVRAELHRSPLELCFHSGGVDELALVSTYRATWGWRGLDSSDLFRV